jgi:hypothetical protein
MLNQPPQYANNGYAYAVPNAPPDSDSKYQGAGPLIVQPKVRNKWYEIFDIGVEARTGSNQANYTSPLTAGSIMRIHTDSAPEYWLVETIVNAATAQLRIYTDADPVGYPVRLGNGGNCCLPSRGRPFLTLVAQGVSIVGTVIAISGYDPGDVFIFGGNQA